MKIFKMFFLPTFFGRLFFFCVFLFTNSILVDKTYAQESVVIDIDIALIYDNIEGKPTGKFLKKYDRVLLHYMEHEWAEIYREDSGDSGWIHVDSIAPYTLPKVVVKSKKAFLFENNNCSGSNKKYLVSGDVAMLRIMQPDSYVDCLGIIFIHSKYGKTNGWIKVEDLNQDFLPNVYEYMIRELEP